MIKDQGFVSYKGNDYKMTNAKFLQAVPDGLATRPSGRWVEEKLDYLMRYIEIFETSMRLKWPERNYIDLFAGPGKNRIKETGEILLGSPLLALTSKYPFSGYFFSELDLDCHNALDIRCSTSILDEKIKVYNQDANKIVTTIVGTIQQFSPRSLNLAFLDPEGLELEWNTVAQLGKLRCDLIINYSQQGLTRYIAKAYESNVETVVDRYFGTKKWRDIYAPWHNKPRKIGLHKELISFYKARLGGLGYHEVKQSDEISAAPLIRNSKNRAPLYRLLFASKDPLGDRFWHQITERDIRGQKQLF
jgi:three-Cys-motif partner protein